MAAGKQTLVRLRSKNGPWLAHPDLRKRLVADATKQGTTLTEVATKILADRYGVKYEPNGRASDPSVSQELLNVALPPKLIEKVKVAAGRAGRSRWQDELRWALCAHYGLRVPEPVKQVRAPRRRPPVDAPAT